MCRYPLSSAASTAAVVSSGGLWNTPRPRAGIVTPLFSVRAGVVAGVIVLWSSRVGCSRVCRRGGGGGGCLVPAALGRFRRRRPTCQQVERLLRRRAGFGGVERQPQAVVGVERQRLVAELELAD